jgi:hypothetical protein
MDRFARPFLVCGLGLFLASSGCRSTKPEVPPGRPFAKDGQQRQAIQFSSEAHPPTAQGSAPYMPANLGGSNIAAGIGTPGGRPDGMSYGGPEAAYGPPGSAGAQPSPTSLGDPSTIRASTNPSASIPLTGTPPPGAPPLNLPPLGSPSGGSAPSTLPDLNVTPPREAPPVGSQANPDSNDKPGALPNPM